MLYDISPPLTPETPVWPGDAPLSQDWICKLGQGDTVNLSTLTSTPHVGAHADAPLHSENDRSSIGEVPLDLYIGPCRVIGLPAPPLIEPHHLENRELSGVARVLFKTGSVRDRRVFADEFTAISAATVALLAELGVRLVGIDTPSVDPFDSVALEAHHALNRFAMVNLEGLDLDAVPPGAYELIALPLKLVGFDASPVRAVLRTLD